MAQKCGGNYRERRTWDICKYTEVRDLRVNNNNYFSPVTDLNQTWLLHIFTYRLFSMFRSCVGLMAAPPENEKWYCPLCLLKKDKTKKGKSKKKKKS